MMVFKKFLGIEIKRAINTIYLPIFSIIFPIFMYIIFGLVMKYDGLEYDYKSSVMVSMSLFGSIQIGLAIATQASLENMRGWNKLLQLSDYGIKAFFSTKLLLAVILSFFPIFLVFSLGISFQVKASFGAMLLSFLICWASVIFFALVGLVIGRFFSGDATIGIASSVLTLLCFLGNLFIPLTGFMLKLAKFNPVYSISILAKWPIFHGWINESVHEKFLVPCLGTIIWLGIFYLGAKWLNIGNNK